MRNRKGNCGALLSGVQTLQRSTKGNAKEDQAKDGKMAKAEYGEPPWKPGDKEACHEVRTSNKEVRRTIKRGTLYRQNERNA